MQKDLYTQLVKLLPGMALAMFLIQAYYATYLQVWLHPEPLGVTQTYRMDKRVSSVLRATAYLSGCKVLVGHAFWIKVLQYYGDATNSKDRYSKLYDYCSLASDLNPTFLAPYTLGAAALTFHLHRPDEAVRLLTKGINSNPRDVSLKLLMASIAYENSEQYDKVVPILESQILTGDAPYMMVNILANAYEKAGRYQDAVQLWQRILRQTDKDDVRIQAAHKLQALQEFMRAGKHPKP